MILNQDPLSMAEAKEYLSGADEGQKELLGFIKKFTKMDNKKSKVLKEKIQSFDLMKVKSEHIIKIIDLMPDNKEDLNKIFADVNLDEDETQKILGAIKELK